MNTKTRTWTILTLLTVGNCGVSFCQQLAFTSRTYVQSPVVISATESSKDFGFGSVAIRNDGRKAIGAVHFQLAIRTAGGDEIAGERRTAVSLEPRETRHLVLDMAHIEGLKQQLRSRRQNGMPVESALVILSIESVEFQDGTVWTQTERDGGITIDPVQKETRSPPRK